MLREVIRAIAIVLIALLSACDRDSLTSDAPIIKTPDIPEQQLQQRNLMVGKWYGSQPIKEGGYREWIVARSRDGNYQIAFRHHSADGGYTQSVEVGDWGVSGGIYFSIFKGTVVNGSIEPSDPTEPANYNAYRLIKLNAQVMEYEHITSGNRFALKRVTPSFVFPSR